MRQRFAARRDIENPFVFATSEKPKANGSGARVLAAIEKALPTGARSGPNDHAFYEPRPVARPNPVAQGAGAVDEYGEPVPGSAGYSYQMPVWYELLSIAGTGIGAYHGYKRNDSIGWGIWWGFCGSVAPIFTIPIAFAQSPGFAKRAK